jgi:beta-glucanase (GH16 family)
MQEFTALRLLVISVFFVSGFRALAWGATNPPPQAGSFTNLVWDQEFNPISLAPGANDSGFDWYKGLWYSATMPNNGLITNPTDVLDLAWNRTQTSAPSLTQVISISHNGTTTAKTFRHGYFEARMKWDVNVGAWPAFWLNPIQEVLGTATQHGEIDIFEGQGSDPRTYYGTLHDWSGSTHLGASSPNNFTLPSTNDFSQWHTYGLLWTNGQVKWYYDDVQVGSANTFSDMESQDYYVLLSMNFGNNWSEGNLSGVTANSSHMQVDWVHVWQSGTAPPPPPPTAIPCDVNGDNAVNVQDVQSTVNQALSKVACGAGDINKDGSCTVIDVQRTVNAVLTGQCVTTP